MISESYAERIRKYIQEAEKNPDILRTQKLLPADYRAMGTAAQLFTKSMLIGLDSSLQKKQFDDEDLISEIENLPYEDAVEYLSKRSILKKDDYYKLSDKLKFRAFTVGRINDGRLLDKLNAEMIKNVNDGKGLKDFLALTKTDILNKIGMGPNQGWYWETVYRTNVQTAYNVGRAMGFEEDPPIALEFVGIDDARQTDTCSSLSGVIRPYDDPFWEGHTPPLHFNCRSTLRGIYDESELPEKWSNVGDVENAAKGFGSWPTENDSWWEELASQTRAAKYYGVQMEIKAAKEILINSKNFIPASTLEEAEKFAQETFIKTNGFDGVFNGKVDFKGISIEHANQINETLNKLSIQFSNVPKLTGIKTVSPKSALGKRVFSGDGSIAAYDTVRGGIYLNSEILKSKKTFEKFIKESNDAFELIKKNINRLSGTQRQIAENYIRAGRSLVDGNTIEGILNHEFAHHIELNLIRTDKELYKRLLSEMDKYALNVSGYASSKGNEYLAESIAAYIKGESEIIDPKLLNFLKSKVLTAKGIKAVIENIEEIKCTIPEAKLTRYCLNPLHATGKHKAHEFEVKLGYTLDNWKDLENNILTNVDKYPMVFVEEKPSWGNIFRCDMLLKGPNGKEASVRTGWILRNGSDVYQLTTAYIL